MEAISIYPGSIGELIQGNYKGIDVLVSCPIDLYTKVRVFESKAPFNKRRYTKAAAFLQNILQQWGYDKYVETIDIEISSQIPSGKGFASSTADLCGTYYSLLQLFKKEADEDMLLSNCIKIEPTDSIIFKNLTVFDYKKGLYKEQLGKYMEFFLLVFEGNKVVNTVEFNNKQLPPLKPVEDLITHAIRGVKSNSLKCIAEASSESILRNEPRLKYDILPKIFKLQQQFSGLGVIGAHSGDMVSIIFDDKEKLNKAYIESCNFKGYKKYILKTLTM